jgi:hypothetical protein
VSETRAIVVAMPTRQPKRLPTPRLAGVYEVAEYLGITRSALAARRVRWQFPAPLVELMCGPIWDLDDIEAYLENHRRDPNAAHRWDNQPGRWQRHWARQEARRHRRNLSKRGVGTKTEQRSANVGLNSLRLAQRSG